MRSGNKQKVLRRLSIIEGQLRGIKNMVENDEYCVDVLTQTEAVKKALSGVDNVLLQNHLQTHVIEQVKRDESNKATDEILKIYKLAQNR